jgi:hypothetical protein
MPYPFISNEVIPVLTLIFAALYTVSLVLLVSIKMTTGVWGGTKDKLQIVFMAIVTAYLWTLWASL